MNHLIIFEGGNQCEIKLIKSKYLLGRSQKCDIKLPYKSVSRVHAAIVRIEDEYYLYDGDPQEDKPSTSGTFVWSKVDSAWERQEVVKLEHGDRVRLCPEAIFRYLRVDFNPPAGDTDTGATML